MESSDKTHTYTYTDEWLGWWGAVEVTLRAFQLMVRIYKLRERETEARRRKGHYSHFKEGNTPCNHGQLLWIFLKST